MRKELRIGNQVISVSTFTDPHTGKRRCLYSRSSPNKAVLLTNADDGMLDRFKAMGFREVP